MTPLSDRHQFYLVNKRRFKIAWTSVFLISVTAAIYYLPFFKWLGGWVIIGGIVLYLWALGKRLSRRQRFILKRSAVPVIFTAGVAWMMESWQSVEGITATVVLLFGAILNLLLISYYEGRTEWPIRFLADVALALAAIPIIILSS